MVRVDFNPKNQDQQLKTENSEEKDLEPLKKLMGDLSGPIEPSKEWFCDVSDLKFNLEQMRPLLVAMAKNN
jgi:hypothetical protein